MPVPKLVATAVLMAAQMAMSALQTTEGPRLTDTRATVADYGTPCNNFVGTRLLPAHCIFAKDIVEKPVERKGKGGKQPTFTGYGSFMVQVAEHTSSAILQIYFDNHLVYDDTGSSEQVYPLADDYDFEAHVRFLFGAEDQEPDPDMLAYIQARDGMPGTCPAYRGQTTIYFENVPLELLGNRYPDVKVLAATGEVTLLPAPDQEIEFVGGQSVDTSGTGISHNFALTGGLAGTPAEGDLVVIVAVNAGTAVAPPQLDPTIAGYTPLATAWSTDNTGFLDCTLAAFGKFMGPVPDTDWTGTCSGSIGYAVLVFRAVHASILDVVPVEEDDTLAGENAPPSITLSNGGVITPGTLISYPSDHCSFTLGLKSASGEQQLVIAAGAARQTVEDSFISAGNLYGYMAPKAYGAVAARACVAWGESMLAAQGSTLEAVLTRVALRGGLEPEEFDFSQATQPIPGYNWTQGTGTQICEHLCDLYDVDLVPHDFVLKALARGAAPDETIGTGEFVAGEEAPYKLPDEADEDLPRRVFMTFADLDNGQEPNIAIPFGGPDLGQSGSTDEPTIDMTTLALEPDTAQALVERWQRRRRFARGSFELGLSRRRIALAPGDVKTIDFDGHAETLACSKLTIGADGVTATEWRRDHPKIAVLPGVAGPPMAGYIPPVVPSPIGSLGLVLDLPLLIDAHDQAAPLAYLAAGPEGPGTWSGASYAASDTGDPGSFTGGWDGIGAGDGAVIGTCTAALPEALPHVPDRGSSVEVTINAGELTAATLEDLLTDPGRNLAAIESGGEWELVQFLDPELTGALTYTISGFLRGVRGTERAIAGHAPGDRFVLLTTAKGHTMGASEIGDTDHYTVSTSGQALDEGAAFALAYTGASHRPLAAVHATVTQSGGDWLFGATRRTRIGGGSLDGQDVPLGETSEAWELDVMDGVTVKRTITGVTLPLAYLEADQIADWGAPLGAAPDANLYQMNPTLSLRGYPLAMAA